MADLQNLLSEDDCASILREALKSKVFTLTRYQIQPFYKQLDGLMGEHYTLNIDLIYENEPKSMKYFLKTLSSNKILQELSKKINVYEKEKFFYELLKKMERYKIDISYAPKGYLFTNTSIVVLEDLIVQGFKGTSKKDALDMEHCILCLETLAKFHASTFNYENAKSTELGRKYSLTEDYREILEEIFMPQRDNGLSRYRKSAIEALLDLVKTIPDNELQFDKEMFKEKLSNFHVSPTPTEESRRRCVLHGDLWSSNFLYKYSEKNGGKSPIEARVLDYQTVAYGAPELDVMKFLMTNTRREFRDMNFEKLARHYFEKLSAFLGSSPKAEAWEWNEFWSSCKTRKLPAKVHAIVDRSITFMSDETYVDAMKTEESFSKFLFEDRSKYVTHSFGTSPEFRELMLEDIRELAELLFE